MLFEGVINCLRCGTSIGGGPFSLLDELVVQRVMLPHMSVCSECCKNITSEIIKDVLLCRAIGYNKNEIFTLIKGQNDKNNFSDLSLSMIKERIDVLEEREKEKSMKIKKLDIDQTTLDDQFK